MIREELQRRAFCRQCNYPLCGLAGNQCPECGTTFDPEDMSTFTLTPAGYHRKRSSNVIGMSVVMVPALFIFLALALTFESLGLGVIALFVPMSGLFGYFTLSHLRGTHKSNRRR